MRARRATALSSGERFSRASKARLDTRRTPCLPLSVQRSHGCRCRSGAANVQLYRRLQASSREPGSRPAFVQRRFHYNTLRKRRYACPRLQCRRWQVVLVGRNAYDLRSSARFAISPNPMACTSRLPMTVPSVGPVITGRFRALAVNWLSIRPGAAHDVQHLHRLFQYVLLQALHAPAVLESQASYTTRQIWPCSGAPLPCIAAVGPMRAGISRG